MAPCPPFSILLPLEHCLRLPSAAVAPPPPVRGCPSSRRVDRWCEAGGRLIGGEGAGADDPVDPRGRGERGDMGTDMR